MTDETPIRIRDMPWEDMRSLLRTIGPEISRLAKRGDKFAIRVLARYQYGFEHPSDMKANRELRVAVEDYMARDLRVAEQLDLGGKFGHRLPEPEKDAGPRIFMPEAIAKQ